MPKLLRKVALISFLLALVSIICYYFVKKEIIFIMFLLSFLISFHLAIRVYGGELFDKIFHNQINYKLGWFKEHFWEKPLYKILCVKKWKEKMPVYEPELFSSEIHTYKEIIMAMCQAEIVHEMNMLLAFIPLIFSIWFKNYFWFLLGTSIFSALIDSLFVMIQRYNKPRVMRVLELQEKKSIRRENAQ